MKLLYPFASRIMDDLISLFLVKEDGGLHFWTRIYISNRSKDCISWIPSPPHLTPRHWKGNEKNLEDMKPSILLGKPNTFSFQWIILCHMVGLQVDFLMPHNDMLKKHMHLCRIWYFKIGTKSLQFSHVFWNTSWVVVFIHWVTIFIHFCVNFSIRPNQKIDLCTQQKFNSKNQQNTKIKFFKNQELLNTSKKCLPFFSYWGKHFLLG